MKETDMMFQYYIEVFLPIAGTATTELSRLFLVILSGKITYLFYFGLPYLFLDEQKIDE